MEGKKLLRSITLANLLSYGSEGVKLSLEPLNVLIGPNASGKSNLIDAISILAAIPRSLLAPFREGGASEDWLWKGGKTSGIAQIIVSIIFPSGKGSIESLYYSIGISLSGTSPRIESESLDMARGDLFIRNSSGEIDFTPGFARLDEDGGYPKLEPQQSVLSQVRDPKNYRELTYVGDQFGKIQFFRSWPFGRGNLLRRPQSVSLPDDFLLEDGSNLGLILNDLQNRRATKRILLEQLRLVYDGIEDVTTKVQGGTIQIFFHEEGLNQPIPAARLSDGTLHYLCLLTVLLHPDPPPLICIEEPELGLHPDIIPKIAELLIDASKRTQLIITTHSETLISALSEVPEAVVVCERDDRGTQLRRLDPENLKEWLDRYRLGDLWAKGEIGGNRW
jgi:predicted ATPase